MKLVSTQPRNNTNKADRASLCVAQNVPKYLSNLQKQSYLSDKLLCYQKGTCGIHPICFGENYLHCLKQKKPSYLGRQTTCGILGAILLVKLIILTHLI